MRAHPRGHVPRRLRQEQAPRRSPHLQRAMSETDDVQPAAAASCMRCAGDVGAWGGCCTGFAVYDYTGVPKLGESLLIDRFTPKK